MEDGPFLLTNLKLPLSGRGPDHVTQFRNFVTPLQLERIELSASYLVQT